MSSLRAAASFLTRVPLHQDGVPAMSKAVPWFGAVGAIIGLVQGGLYLGLAELTTPGVAAAVATATVALITGAFHHDGLADIADAFGGGWTREQRLEILKDSRLGTYGVTALVFVIVIEVAALSALDGWVALAAAVAAHGVSRTAATVVMTTARPAQASGLGVDYLSGLRRPAVWFAALAMTCICVVLVGLATVFIALGAALASLAVVQLSYRKIDGISGDVLGAVQQITKVTVLVVMVACARSLTDDGPLWGIALG